MRRLSHTSTSASNAVDEVRNWWRHKLLRETSELKKVPSAHLATVSIAEDGIWNAISTDSFKVSPTRAQETKTEYKTTSTTLLLQKSPQERNSVEDAREATKYDTAYCMGTWYAA